MNGENLCFQTAVSLAQGKRENADEADAIENKEDLNGGEVASEAPDQRTRSDKKYVGDETDDNSESQTRRLLFVAHRFLC